MKNLCYKCLKALSPNEEKLHGLHPSCFQKWFELPKPLDFQDLALTYRQPEGPLALPAFHTLDISFFQGKFKKYSATLNGLHYLLKIEQPGYPELPAMEYLCNQIARFLKLEIPDFYLIRFQNNLDAFIVKNFMQKIAGGNLIHIYHYLKRLQDYNCQTVLYIIQKKTERFEDQVQFIKMCLFDALIGNNDRHGSNFGFIQTIEGFKLAPLYDNPSYLAREEEWLLDSEQNPRGTLLTQNTNTPTIKDYAAEFKQLGFTEVVASFHKAIKLEKIFLLVDNAFISQKRKEAFKRLIKNRYEELINE